MTTTEKIEKARALLREVADELDSNASPLASAVTQVAGPGGVLAICLRCLNRGPAPQYAAPYHAQPQQSQAAQPEDSTLRDVVSALTNLGMKPTVAQEYAVAARGAAQDNFEAVFARATALARKK